ncbi:MAG: YwaF family protein [Clostridia bacterium]|nr:YwaF family protein [Clostridia bacterium]
MKEFFGFGGYERPAEGFLSWQHLVFVSSFLAVIIVLAIYFGRKFRDKSYEEKNKVLIWTAIILDSIEIIRIIISCIRSGEPDRVLYELPLFLCSIQLIAIPVAAFSKGRLKEASLDFVFIFGMLGAVLGTYGAGQNYAAYPVLSFDNVFSALTHTIAGFATIYIGLSGMKSMKPRNIPITYAILLAFCVLAAIGNTIVPYNYMFLVSGDGTPYDILYNLVGGNPVLYPMMVILLFLIYIAAFYGVYMLIAKRLGKNKTATEPITDTAEENAPEAIIK